MGSLYPHSRYNMALKVVASVLLLAAAVAANALGNQADLETCTLENTINKEILSNLNATALAELEGECTLTSGFSCTGAILAVVGGCLGAGFTHGAALTACIGAAMSAPAACQDCICAVINNLCVPLFNLCLSCYD